MYTQEIERARTYDEPGSILTAGSFMTGFDTGARLSWSAGSITYGPLANFEVGQNGAGGLREGRALIDETWQCLLGHS